LEVDPWGNQQGKGGRKKEKGIGKRGPVKGKKRIGID